MASQDELSYRAATPADRPAVARLCREIHPDDYLPEIFPEWAGRRDGSLMVAEAAGQVVAIVGYQAVKPTEAYMMSMRVSPSFQGHGIGRGLTRYATEQAIAAGFTALRLTTRRNNFAAQAMLDAVGYRRAGEWDIVDDWPVAAVGDAMEHAGAGAAGDTAAGPAGAADSAATHADGVRRLNPGDLHWFWPWIQAVSQASAPAGLIAQPGETFEVLSLAKADVEEALAEREVWVAGPAAAWEGGGAAPDHVLAASAFALVEQGTDLWILRQFAGASGPCAALWRRLVTDVRDAVASGVAPRVLGVSLPGNQFAVLRQAGLIGYEEFHWPGYIYDWPEEAQL